MDESTPAGVVWVPLAPAERLSMGVLGSYRRCLGNLNSDALAETATAAEAAVSHLLANGEMTAASRAWVGHGGALVVYAMWALYELRGGGLIDREEFDVRLNWLAAIQYEVPQRRQSWRRPTWWGSDVHEQHYVALKGRR